MHSTLLALLLALAALPATADPRTYAIATDGKNIASFRIEDAVETIDGSTVKVTGTIVADPANAAASSVEISADLSAIDTGMSLRDNHIRDEFVETRKFPRATFKSVSVAMPATIAANQPVDVMVTGDFTMHGVTKRITTPVRVVLIPETAITRSTRGAGDWIHATATFPLTLSEFGVKVPTSFASDHVDVKLDVFASRRPSS
jgi:polyisoprenoid-binding protein YceI